MRLPTALVFAAAGLLCCFFFAQGYMFIRQVGVQEDEAQFVSAIFPPLEAPAFFEVGGSKWPLMVNNYAGGLKALAYMGIFKIWPADVRSLRVPVLLLGTATVFLFFLFFRMTMGDLTALIATALLATESVFLVTTVLDFGVAAAQHFFAAAALPLFVLYHRTRRRWLLALACVLCGLGLWDKVTFIWVLAGLGAGLLAAFRREIRPHLSGRWLGFAALWIAIGAFPLLYFNVIVPAGTSQFKGGLSVPTSQKVAILARTLNGSSLFGYLTRSPSSGRPSDGETRLERTAVSLSRATGHPERHGLLAASIVSVVLMIVMRPAPARRAMLFSVVAFFAGWVFMLPFYMGGGGSHHVILLWPLPQMLVALALTTLARWIPRAGAAIALLLAAALAIQGALVTNECYARIVSVGASDFFSDAINPLRALLVRTGPYELYPLDWGIRGPLRCLGRGNLPLSFIDDPLENASLTEQQRSGLRSVLELPGRYFLVYADRSAHSNDYLERLRGVAKEFGFREEVYAQVPDRHGRPIYQILRYVPPSLR
jgi:hypothetical protein